MRDAMPPLIPIKLQYYLAMIAALLTALVNYAIWFDQPKPVSTYTTAVCIATFVFLLFFVAFLVLTNRVNMLPTLISLIAIEAGLIALFARAYIITGVIDSSKITHAPEICLYFSIITWTTVGYGDVVPTSAARMWAAAEALISYFTISVFVGTFAALFRSANTRQ